MPCSATGALEERLKSSIRSVPPGAGLGIHSLMEHLVAASSAAARLAAFGVGTSTARGHSRAEAQVCDLMSEPKCGPRGSCSVVEKKPGRHSGQREAGRAIRDVDGGVAPDDKITARRDGGAGGKTKLRCVATVAQTPIGGLAEFGAAVKYSSNRIMPPFGTPFCCRPSFVQHDVPTAA